MKRKKIIKAILSVVMVFALATTMVGCNNSNVRATTPLDLVCTHKELTNSTFTEGIATIAWSQSDDAKGYEIYCKNGNEYELLGTTEETSYTLENLKEGETYSIVVKAYKDEKKANSYSDYSEALDVNVSKNELGVKVYNGNMIGTLTDGVYSYKGIHYAKDAGTPETRWKKPVSVEASDEDVDASEYGKVAFQVPWHSESSSLLEQGEDCLTLDVWTNSPNDTDAKKPVFVWIHGGSNILGGSADPLYTGQNLIENCGDDIVYVAINYRVNCMGVMNFSQVEGGEDYADAGWLCLYDDIEALRWIKKNIEQFGGDPDQVTIAGESAGGSHVSLLPLMEECEEEGLFNKVICESGNPTFTTLEAESYNPTKVMMDGYKYNECVESEEYGTVKGLGKGEYPTMTDLANLSEKEMWTLMFYCGCCAWDEESQRAYRVADSTGNYNFAIRGGQNNPLLNARFDSSIEKMAEQYQDLDYFDLLIGTTSNEYDYWIGEMSNKYEYDENGNVKTYIALDGTEKPMIDEGAAPTENDYSTFSESMSLNWSARYSLIKQFGIGDEINVAFKKAIAENTGVQKGVCEDAMKSSMLATEAVFALPAQLLANYHSKSGGKTYMYYWKHPSDVPGFNAGHAVELAYVFGVDSDDHFVQCCGTTDDNLMDKTMKTWVSFVKDGTPTVANQDTEWPEYDEEKKTTMVINDTSKNTEWTVEENPDNEIRDLLTNKDGTQTPFTQGDNTYKSYFDFVLRGLVITDGSK